MLLKGAGYDDDFDDDEDDNNDDDNDGEEDHDQDLLQWNLIKKINQMKSKNLSRSL